MKYYKIVYNSVNAGKTKIYIDSILKFGNYFFVFTLRMLTLY